MQSSNKSKVPTPSKIFGSNRVPDARRISSFAAGIEIVPDAGRPVTRASKAAAILRTREPRGTSPLRPARESCPIVGLVLSGHDGGSISEWNAVACPSHARRPLLPWSEPPGVTTQSSCDRNGERGNALFGGLVSHFSWTGSSYPFRFSSPTRVARGMDEGNSACMMDKGLPCPDLVGDQSGLDSDRLRKPTPHRALS